LDKVAIDDILRYQQEIFAFFDNSHKELLDEIAKTGNLPDESKLNAAIKEFEQTFEPSKQDDGQKSTTSNQDQTSATSND
jgi:F-type H+-transporting ATPase subunit alpha